MADIQAPWDPKYKDRVAVYDYYVPEIQYVALALGKDPTAITDADLPAIKDKLAALKANAAMVGDVTPVQQALATGAVDILVGGGEWVTAGMAKDKPSLDYIIPKQGGIRWQQGLGVFAGSKNKALGTKFIQYILSPEGQAQARDLVLLLGHARQQQGGADAGAEDDPALGRPARLYQGLLSLSADDAGDGSEAAGALGAGDAG